MKETVEHEEPDGTIGDGELAEALDQVEVASVWPDSNMRVDPFEVLHSRFNVLLRDEDDQTEAEDDFE